MSRPEFTRHCGYCCEPESVVGKLSYRGLCADCGREAMIAAHLQQSAKAGPHHERRVMGRLKGALAEAERLGLSV